MLYSALRGIIAILLITPLLAFAKVRGIFRNATGLFIGYILTIFAVCIPLSFWPFENYFGGFNSVEQAMEYEHGKVKIQGTIETETSIFVISDITGDMVFKVKGRCFLNCPVNLMRKYYISDRGYFVSIYKDRYEKQSYVVIDTSEGNRRQKNFSDNKGSKIEGGFVEDGMAYFFGSFAYDDGSAYRLYNNGREIILKLFD